MKTDKAAIRYHGKTQAEAAFEQLSRFCEKVFLSDRNDQGDLPGHMGLPQIHDTFHEIGPMGGILSALAVHPDVPWLVVACDLPYLDDGTLENLIRRRNPGRLATAYTSAHDGKPEPLCAIYEPHSRGPLEAFVARGIQCPRKALMQSDVELLDPVNPTALDNMNTEEESRAALHELQKMSKDE
jgi:molybdopterin-guanine dinucleotide biosynthesis protein A